MSLRPIILLFAIALASAVPAQTAVRRFARDPRTPVTPPAPHARVAEASTRALPAPLPRMRSGRAWPRHHFTRTPATAPAAAPAGHPVDANLRRGSAARGFWAPR